MWQEYHICQCLSRLEGTESRLQRSLDSDCPSCGVECCHLILGERRTLYLHLSQCLQMAHRSFGPPHEENCEYWASDSSKGCSMRLIPIEDVTVSPPLASSSSEDREYHEAPVEEEGGIMDVSDWDLDLAGR